MNCPACVALNTPRRPGAARLCPECKRESNRAAERKQAARWRAKRREEIAASIECPDCREIALARFDAGVGGQRPKCPECGGSVMRPVRRPKRKAVSARDAEYRSLPRTPLEQLDDLRLRVWLDGDAVLAGLLDYMPSGTLLFDCPACSAGPGEPCDDVYRQSEGVGTVRPVHEARRDSWLAWRLSPEIDQWVHAVSALRLSVSRP